MPAKSRNTACFMQDTVTFPIRNAQLCLCVDGACRGEPYGRIRCFFLPKEIVFTSFADLFLKMDRIFDLLDAPHASVKMRRCIDPNVQWRDTPLADVSVHSIHMPELEQSGKPRGALATFWVQMLYRQNASWQGMLLDAGREKHYFRSALELLYLLHDKLPADRRAKQASDSKQEDRL